MYSHGFVMLSEIAWQSCVSSNKKIRNTTRKVTKHQHPGIFKKRYSYKTSDFFYCLFFIAFWLYVFYIYFHVVIAPKSPPKKE